MTDPRELIQRGRDHARLWPTSEMTTPLVTDLADALEAALARVAALEDALRGVHDAAERLDRALIDTLSAGTYPAAAFGQHLELRLATEKAAAALAPSVPRTLETDLREDR